MQVFLFHSCTINLLSEGFHPNFSDQREKWRFGQVTQVKSHARASVKHRTVIFTQPLCHSEISISSGKIKENTDTLYCGMTELRCRAQSIISWCSHCAFCDIIVFIISYSFVTRVSWRWFEIIRQICRLVRVGHTAVISAWPLGSKLKRLWGRAAVVLSFRDIAMQGSTWPQKITPKGHTGLDLSSIQSKIMVICDE